MEAKKLVLVSIALCALLCVQVCHGSDQDFTIEVKPGKVECFWQYLNFTGKDVEFEYQVIDGGDLDIDFALYAPDGGLLKSEQRETESIVRVTLRAPGDYKFCFDNTFSRMAEKVVFFEFVVDDGEDDEEWNFDMEEIKELVDMTFDEIKGVIDRSRGNLDKSIQIQNFIRAHEARDRNIVEANYARINIFSAFQIFVMLTVSLTQVLMIRNLFQNKGHSGIKAQT